MFEYLDVIAVVMTHGDMKVYIGCRVEMHIQMSMMIHTFPSVEAQKYQLAEYLQNTHDTVCVNSARAGRPR